MIRLCLALSLCATSAAAQDWNLRSSDTRFTPDALTAYVSGRTFEYYDDGQSRFSPGGSYSYTYSAVNGGGTQFGVWAVGDGGTICITYRNNRTRCDLYVEAGGALVVLTEDGGRYPTRP